MMSDLATELPISFSPVMAARVANKRKSQTRRVVTAQTSLLDGGPCYRDPWSQLRFDEAWVDGGPSPAGNTGPYLKVPRIWENGDRTVHRIYPRHQPGVKLWVREEWWTGERFDHAAPSKLPPDAPVWYQRDWLDADLRQELWGRTRRSMHLPRVFSGMELEVVECRPERIQDISGEDAMAEGVIGHLEGRASFWTCTDDLPPALTPVGAFGVLWDSINAARGYGWKINPWVWATSFRLLRAIRSTA